MISRLANASGEAQPSVVVSSARLGRGAGAQLRSRWVSSWLRDVFQSSGKVWKEKCLSSDFSKTLLELEMIFLVHDITLVDVGSFVKLCSLTMGGLDTGALLQADIVQLGQ